MLHLWLHRSLDFSYMIDNNGQWKRGGTTNAQVTGKHRQLSGPKTFKEKIFLPCFPCKNCKEMWKPLFLSMSFANFINNGTTFCKNT